MTAFAERLRPLEERIDALSLRERALIFAGLLAGLVLFAANGLFPMLARESRALEAALRAQHESLARVQDEIAKAAAEYARDPDAYHRARIAELETKLRSLETQLAGRTRGLVGPREMTRLVRETLARRQGLELVRLENLPPEEIRDRGGEEGTPGPGKKTARENAPPPDAPAATTRPSLYRHGLRIELRGRYPEIGRYLASLEQLPWQVFWGRLELKKLTTRDVAQMSLVIYTLSADRAWLGL
jgi:MSHA biogenesis protein MshJ